MQWVGPPCILSKITLHARRLRFVMASSVARIGSAPPVGVACLGEFARGIPTRLCPGACFDGTTGDTDPLLTDSCAYYRHKK
jgi:hypothetical protein